MSSLPNDKQFYRVEAVILSETNCKCPSCIQWTIVHTDAEGEEEEIGTSWEGEQGEETAHDICDLMNMAYDAGKEAR